ncbi:MAG: PD40 domain-containing protein [Bacteroides sp.]|nr:PD40 domain-containing protein [Bacteroides sp.]
MVKTFLYRICLGIIVGLFASCSQDVKITERVEEASPLVEEYAGIIVPPNIASVNFFVEAADGQEALVLSCGDVQLSTICQDGAVIPELEDWKELMTEAKGKEVQVEHCVRTPEGWKAYQAFSIQVAEEDIDSHLAYRLIPPGYEMWNEMGIYQRNLENFEESVILDNKQTDRGCMNCHSFRMQDPEQMMFHLRAKHAGTMLIQGDEITKLETKTEQTISALVYPYWHPSGKYIAYSVNDTKQLFHTNHANRIEVMDLASDVVVYDVEKNEIVTAPAIFDADVFETFPSFSPDGKTLYYCASRRQSIPDDTEKLRYHLCAVSFDAETRTFGEKVDTLYHAEKMNKSVSFPRVSPDGKHLMFTLADFATFPIWHQEADLWMLDLQEGKVECLDVLNSNSVESYHSWSSNSRWVVFSSRRMDGLYTRPYIAYVRADGTVGKSFVLPQAKGDFYDKFMNSYNIPELIKGKVDVNRYELLQKVLDDEKKQVTSRI